MRDNSVCRPGEGSGSKGMRGSHALFVGVAGSGQGCEKGAGMVADGVTRYHPYELDDVGIVAEGQDPRVGDLGGKQGLGPQTARLGTPGAFPIACQPVNKDNTVGKSAVCFSERMLRLGGKRLPTRLRHVPDCKRS